MSTPSKKRRKTRIDKIVAEQAPPEEEEPIPDWARPLLEGPRTEQAKPSAPPPAADAAETWKDVGGPRQPRDPEAERLRSAREEEHEAERQRLLRIANEAGPRWFTT
jgi:hypothetical protein